MLLVPVNSRSPKCAGRRAPPKSETVRKRSAEAVDDQKWSKNRPSQKTQFSPPSRRTGGLTGTKKAFPNSLKMITQRQTGLQNYCRLYRRDALALNLVKCVVALLLEVRPTMVAFVNEDIRVAEQSHRFFLCLRTHARHKHRIVSGCTSYISARKQLQTIIPLCKDPESLYDLHPP